MNFVILMVLLFVVNLGFYVVMCMLYLLLKDNMVSLVFMKVNKCGVLMNVLFLILGIVFLFLFLGFFV